MALSSGTRLGPYVITAHIGAGGMGEVYRATDTTLKRDVAIKVLPDGLTHDTERLARFEREAHVLASLNHPHIAHIHGLEQADGVQALVLELVEGPTLAERIAQGPIAIEEALPIAKQIAEAVEAAHEQGIIHRDLKPANIKVRPDGTVKVLDFGLASVVQGSGAGAIDATHSPTLTLGATRAGVILGTAAYMSPEQAAGKPVDKRADIWSFGVVLWEVLSARRLFDGETVPTRLPTSCAARSISAHCLSIRRRRFTSCSGDAWIVKHPNGFSPDGRFLIYDDHTAQRQDLWILPIEPSSGGERKPIPFLVTPADETFGQFSPDGKWIAYSSDESGRREVYVQGFVPDRVPAAGVGKWLMSTAGGDKPRWRRDGTELSYLAPDRKMMAVPVKLGPPFEPGVAIPLFETRTVGFFPYDVSPDGRFLLNWPVENEALRSSPITIVRNWEAGLKR